jgi:hypothetical protein
VSERDAVTQALVDQLVYGFGVVQFEAIHLVCPGSLAIGGIVTNMA